LGNDKEAQFPSLVRALEPLRRSLRAPLLLDAEIVALDGKGNPQDFQRLQGRIHLTGAREVEQVDKARPVALIAFDLLRDGDQDIRGLPLTERRARLDARIGPHVSAALRISEQTAEDGTALDARARREGWEGLIVKEAAAPYQSGTAQPCLAQAQGRP
jgi:bifunctional non-homologous end joining protein LigD